MGRRRVERWWRLADLRLVEQGSESYGRESCAAGEEDRVRGFFSLPVFSVHDGGRQRNPRNGGSMSLHKCLYFGKKIECYDCLHIETEGVATSKIPQTNHQLAHAVCSPDTRMADVSHVCAVFLLLQ